MSNRLSIKDAAELMGVSQQFIRLGLQKGALPFGCAIRNHSRWSYFISAVKFTEHTGIQIPVKKEEAPTGEAMPSECPRTLTTIV